MTHHPPADLPRMAAASADFQQKEQLSPNDISPQCVHHHMNDRAYSSYKINTQNRS